MNNTGTKTHEEMQRSGKDTALNAQGRANKIKVRLIRQTIGSRGTDTRRLQTGNKKLAAEIKNMESNMEKKKRNSTMVQEIIVSSKLKQKITKNPLKGTRCVGVNMLVQRPKLTSFSTKVTHGRHTLFSP